MKRCSPYCVAVLCITAVAAVAQTTNPQEGIVSTTQHIVLAGKTLAYSATAGRLPIINNDAGEPHGYMFFVAYTVRRAPGELPRPLTFIWNGGPGSSSSELHLMGFGPKRLKIADTYPDFRPLTADTPVVDNQETWLDLTDLVFVDPIGTGYSRPTKPEYGAEFYNTVGDAESVAEFIRVYRQRYDRFDSPLFLVGESYGTTRAQWVAEALERRRTQVSGVVLMSGPVELDQKLSPAMEAALLVPRFTTTAFYYKKLPPDLQAGTLQALLEKANQWARSTYAPALERLDGSTPVTSAEREAITAELVRFTGVEPSLVDPKTLMTSPIAFTDHLLQSEGRDLGRYDTRMSDHRAGRPWTPKVDASLRPVLDMMQGTSPLLIRYLRDDLKYKSDLLYRGPFGESYPAPKIPNGDWMSVGWAHDATPKGVPAFESLPGGEGIPLITPLHRAMELNPSLRIMLMTGMYDNAAADIGCDLAAYSVSQVDISLRDRVTSHCYAGGHMMYFDKASRQQMKRDMEEMVRAAGTAARGRKTD